MSQPAETVVAEVWEEGDLMISRAFRWIAERYERPAVIDDAWRELDSAIDDPYESRDPEALRQALWAFARHVVSQSGSQGSE